MRRNSTHNKDSRWEDAPRRFWIHKRWLKAGFHTFAVMIMLVVLTMGIAGCQSRDGSMFSWYSQREARAVDAASKEQSDARDALVREARSEVHKASQAIRGADQEDLPVQLTRRFVDNALPSLDQVAGPMTATEAAELRELVDDLLAGKADAEARQRTAESRLQGLSNDLAEAEQRLAAAQSDLRSAYDRENALADKHRRTLLVTYGATALGLIATGAAWYFRSQGSGLIRSIGGSLKDLDAEDPQAAAVATRAFDTNLSPALHSIIRRARVS